MGMTWAKNKRKAAVKAEKKKTNGGVYVPSKRRDPEITARAIANRKKVAATSRRGRRTSDSEESDTDCEQQQSDGAVKGKQIDGPSGKEQRLDVSMEDIAVGEHQGETSTESVVTWDLAHTSEPEPVKGGKRKATASVHGREAKRSKTMDLFNDTYTEQTTRISELGMQGGREPTLTDPNPQIITHLESQKGRRYDAK